MAGKIAGDGESILISSLPETEKFVSISIHSGDGEEENLKENDLDLAESEGFRVCRICQLIPDLAESDWEKIEIGCGCRGELGSAHRRCAEAWFRVKKNRICEICGLTAKNIVGEEDSSFMKLWNDGASHEAGSDQSLQVRASCLISKSFCNFFLSFLVIALVLPWFFKDKFF